MASLQGGAAYFIMPDHLGAPHEIVNAANARVWFWDHDPFGNGTPTAAAGFSHDLRFPGQIYDSETRLHNNGFRDYSPTLGRYVESDPIGLAGGINTYTYAGNNPVSLIDPLGLDPEKCDRSCYRSAGSIVLGAGGVVAGALGGFAIGGGEGFGLSAVTGPGVIVGTAGGAIVGAGAGAYAGALWGVNAGAAVGEAIYNLTWFSESHHPWPKYLGGPKAQDLVRLPKPIHNAYHSGLDKILPRQWGSAYYANLGPAARLQMQRDLADYSQAFDNKYGTQLYESILQHGLLWP